jgi:hypothetical protein
MATIFEQPLFGADNSELFLAVQLMLACQRPIYFAFVFDGI